MDNGIPDTTNVDIETSSDSCAIGESGARLPKVDTPTHPPIGQKPGSVSNASRANSNTRNAPPPKPERESGEISLYLSPPTSFQTWPFSQPGTYASAS